MCVSADGSLGAGRDGECAWKLGIYISQPSSKIGSTNTTAFLVEVSGHKLESGFLPSFFLSTKCYLRVFLFRGCFCMNFLYQSTRVWFSFKSPPVERLDSSLLSNWFPRIPSLYPFFDTRFLGTTTHGEKKFVSWLAWEQPLSLYCTHPWPHEKATNRHRAQFFYFSCFGSAVNMYIKLESI